MKKRSLKFSLYIVFALSALMPFFLISIVITHFFNGQILSSYKINNGIILQSVTSHLNSQMQNSERFFLQYLFDTNISRFYHSVNNRDYDSSQENLYQYIRDSSKYRSSLNNYLTAFNPYHSGVGFIPVNANKDTCFFLNKYGNNIIIYPTDTLKSQSWYQNLPELALGEVLFLQGSIMENCDEYENSEPVYTMLRPINHLETASRQGYVFLEVTNTVFSDITGKISLPKDSGLGIYFSDGSAAYYTDKKFLFSKEEVRNNSTAMGEKKMIDGKLHYVYAMKDEKYDFYVYYLLPYSTLLKQANHSSLFILMVWVISMLVSFFIFMRLIKHISASTNKIMDYIKEYRLGEQNENRKQLPQMPVEEFNDISLALSEMTDRITALVQHEYIGKLNQQMAEYKALQAEINPHFFNNVMNSLLSLNRIDDKKNLEKGILSLSRMFRYTCEHGYDSNLIQECRFIENYLMLEKIRFEERLHYQIDIEFQLEEITIPKLLLQPIVENAMHHGMSPDGKPLHIHIHICEVKSCQQGNFIWISIANDGIPYQKEELLKNDRVGLSNVYERMRINYPDSFMWFEQKGTFNTICNLLIRADRSKL